MRRAQLKARYEISAERLAEIFNAVEKLIGQENYGVWNKGVRELLRMVGLEGLRKGRYGFGWDCERVAGVVRATLEVGLRGEYCLEGWDDGVALLEELERRFGEHVAEWEALNVVETLEGRERKNTSGLEKTETMEKYQQNELSTPTNQADSLIQKESAVPEFGFTKRRTSDSFATKKNVVGLGNPKHTVLLKTPKSEEQERPSRVSEPPKWNNRAKKEREILGITQVGGSVQDFDPDGRMSSNVSCNRVSVSIHPETHNSSNANWQ